MSDTPTQPMSERVLALAGLAQALAQVRRIADTGQANGSVLATSLDSIFRIDADTAAGVYGGREHLRPGLMLLRDYFGGRPRDDDAMARKVREGIQAQGGTATEHGSTHPDVLAALGGLYADTLSHLRPRVLVQGNPHYLGQPAVVAEVRAVLLAAMRSAVLWRQLGGSLWDFLLRRRDMAAAVDAQLR